MRMRNRRHISFTANVFDVLGAPPQLREEGAKFKTRNAVAQNFYDQVVETTFEYRRELYRYTRRGDTVLS